MRQGHVEITALPKRLSAQQGSSLVVPSTNTKKFPRDLETCVQLCCFYDFEILNPAKSRMSSILWPHTEINTLCQETVAYQKLKRFSLTMGLICTPLLPHSLGTTTNELSLHPKGKKREFNIHFYCGSSTYAAMAFETAHCFNEVFLHTQRFGLF